MSNLAGKFKAKVLYAETSPEDSSWPYLKVLFKLTHQFNTDILDWEELNIENTLVAQTYGLNKVAKNADSKCSPYEYSTAAFKKTYGVEMFDPEFATTEDLSMKIREQEKELILEADATDFHKIKWVNNLGGGRKVKEGLSSLHSLR